MQLLDVHCYIFKEISFYADMSAVSSKCMIQNGPALGTGV